MEEGGQDCSSLGASQASALEGLRCPSPALRPGRHRTRVGHRACPWLMMGWGALTEYRLCFQLRLFRAEPDTPWPRCCSTAAAGTHGSSWLSRDTCVASRTPTETRKMAAPQRSVSTGPTLTFLSAYSPLHLAIIHQQTGVIQQLIHTLLSGRQQDVLNTANHLRQVDMWAPVAVTSVQVTL